MVRNERNAPPRLDTVTAIVTATAATFTVTVTVVIVTLRESTSRTLT